MLPGDVRYSPVSIHEDEITTDPVFDAILLIFVFMAQLVKGLELALLELPPRVP